MQEIRRIGGGGGACDTSSLWTAFGTREGANYSKVLSVPHIRNAAEEALHSSGLLSDLTLHQDALEHLLRLLRVLRRPRGHSVVVGAEASEARNLAKLGAHIAGFGVEEATPLNWREVLENATQNSVEETVLLVEASADRALMHRINALLSSDEIRDLHLVVLVAENKRELLKQYPALASCATVDQYTRLTKESLKAIAAGALAGLPVEDSQLKEWASACVELLQRTGGCRRKLEQQATAFRRLYERKLEQL